MRSRAPKNPAEARFSVRGEQSREAAPTRRKVGKIVSCWCHHTPLGCWLQAVAQPSRTCYAVSTEAKMPETTFVPDEDAITSVEAAAMLGVHRLTLYRNIKNGNILAARDLLSGYWRVSRSSVQAILDTRNGRGWEA